MRIPASYALANPPESTNIAARWGGDRAASAVCVCAE